MLVILGGVEIAQLEASLLSQESNGLPLNYPGANFAAGAILCRVRPLRAKAKSGLTVTLCYGGEGDPSSPYDVKATDYGVIIVAVFDQSDWVVSLKAWTL